MTAGCRTLRASRAYAVRLAVIAVSALAAILVPATAPALATTEPQVTFTLMTPLPEHLDVGERAVIRVRVDSNEPFAMAIALSDAYFPGRGVLFDGSAAHAHDTSADLELTIVGRESTADLPAALGWPTADQNWPAGIAPVAVRVGARFAGGYVASASYVFAVTVS
jgi:hypothetical protein